MCAKESMWVAPAPWMHGYATRSVAAASVAVTIVHSAGQGTSSAFWVAALEASETVTPSLTSATAARRLAGVIRLRAPISSSLPQRPQFESSFCQRSYSAAAMTGRDVSGLKEEPWADSPIERAEADSATVTAPTIFFSISRPLQRLRIGD